MADVFTKEQRSEIMRQVKSAKNKSTELKLIAFFKENHITGWRRNSKLFGKPDFTFPKHRAAIFVDGCFWHGHDCRNTRPKNNADYWTKKRERNINRDKFVTQTLENKGWTVVRIWECELKNQQILEAIKLKVNGKVERE
ncbi:MAG: very short patch repair endonuclease [Prevotellaceae bacterium]|jgi:DNA mismatch endonuclease (patch repair protein)|nr:very short patch repair endonuclease [Prevotellaceae bacterium]